MSPRVADPEVQRGPCATVRDRAGDRRDGWIVQASRHAPLADLDEDTREVLEDADLLDRIERRRSRPISEAVPIADFISGLDEAGR